VTITRSGVLEILRKISNCPTCEGSQRFVVVVPASPYYGPTSTCLACGDSWTDGERHERPFRPRWRKEAIAEAKRDWDNAFEATDEQRREAYGFDGGTGE